MAVRTVSVELKMKISDFELAAAKAAATTKALAGEFDDLGKTSSKFSTAKPTKEMQNFSRVITASLKDGKTGFQSIQQAIDDTKVHIAGLQHQIRTGSGSTSIFGDLKQAQKDLRTLENIFKSFGDEGSQVGKSWTQNFGKAAADLIPGVSTPIGLAVGAGVVAAASPFIVAGLAAAIAGGVGGGFIAAAAIIQHNNPILKTAFAQFKSDAVATGKSATSALVQPFAEALASADRFVTREGPSLTKLFSDLAPAIRPLEADLEQMGATLLPALDKAAQGFTKAISSPEVSSSLQALSNQFATLFNTIGDHPKEIADGFRTIFTVINAGVSVVNAVTSAYAKADDTLTRWHDDIQNWIDKQGGATDANKKFATTSEEVRQAGIRVAGSVEAYNKQLADLAQQSQIASGDLSSLATELGAVKITADTLAAGLEDRVFTSMMNSDLATLGWNQALTNLSATLKANHGIVDENAKSTIKHRQAAEADTGAILGAVSANQQVYQTMIASGVSAEDAARAYDSNEGALRRQLRAAGLTKKQVDGLIGTYDKVPDNVNTVIAVQGLTKAINNLDETLRLLNHLDGFHANATVTTTYYTKNKPHTGPLAQNISRWGNIYEPAADGLLTHAQIYSPVNPGRFMIAEPATGGEGFVPKNGDYGRSMSIIKAEAGWYGASVVEGGGRGGGNMQIMVSAAPGFQQAFLQFLRFTIKDGGGDVVRVLTPK